VVLRMDHHCPWVGNTIGFGNYKYFILFLLYATSSCLFANIDIVHLLATATLTPSAAHLLFGSGSIMALLSSVMVPFSGFHLWLLSQNMTTIEYCQHRSRAQSADNDQDRSSYYDIGLMGNLSAVLGDNPLMWPFQCGQLRGMGSAFPSDQRMKHYLANFECPRQCACRVIPPARTDARTDARTGARTGARTYAQPCPQKAQPSYQCN